MSRGLPTFPTKKRGKFYRIRITAPDGTRPWLNLGDNINEAKLAFNDYRKQILSQRSDYPSYRPTIKQCIDKWIENKKSRFGEESKTYSRYWNYRTAMFNFFEKKYPELQFMDGVEERHILDFRDFRKNCKNRAGNNLSPVTINNELDAVHNLFEFLIEEQNLDLRNPVKKKMKLDEGEPDEFYYKVDEVVKFLETARQFCKRINWHAIFIILFNTGIRRNELRFLTWENIDFKSKEINIRPKQITPNKKFRVKGRKPRVIPMSLEVEQAIKSLPKKSDIWVFTNSRGNIFSTDTIRTVFRKICKTAGLPVKKQHKTRHSWTSIAFEKGVAPSAIQSVGGWTKAATMERYNHSGQNKEFLKDAFKDFSIGGNNEA